MAKCISADDIQRQYLLIGTGSGNGTDGQHHIKLSGVIGVCGHIHVDVLIGQRPFPAFRQISVGIRRQIPVLPVKTFRCSLTHRIQKRSLIHTQRRQQIGRGELPAAGNVVQINVIEIRVHIHIAVHHQRQDIVVLIGLHVMDR